MPTIKGQRRLYEKTKVALGLVFYPIFLVAIKLKWLFLPDNPILKSFLLLSIPLMLLLLYLTSYKKIFPGNIGDYLQASFEILIIIIGSIFFGGGIMVSTPFFILLILLIPLYILLLNSTLLFYIASITSLLLVWEFLFLKTVEFSFVSVIDLSFKALASLVMAFISSNTIKHTIFEEKVRLELQKAYKELKKLDEAKSEFLSIAAHQLRTPLTAIKGYLSLINERIYGEFPKKMQKPLDNIYSSSERLIKLVGDLLNISRIEAGKIKLNIEKFPLEDIIDSVVIELTPLANKKGLDLIWETPKKAMPKVLVDKEKIRQVVLNVIDNAIRYTKRGGATVRYRKGNKICRLIVSDTGEGMARKEIAELFKSFKRGSVGQRTWTEGTGLGLYISKKFVDLHQGKIWAKSPGKGKGSTFYIELPAE